MELITAANNEPDQLVAPATEEEPRRTALRVAPAAAQLATEAFAGPRDEREAQRPDNLTD